MTAAQRGRVRGAERHAAGAERHRRLPEDVQGVCAQAAAGAGADPGAAVRLFEYSDGGQRAVPAAAGGGGGARPGAPAGRGRQTAGLGVQGPVTSGAAAAEGAQGPPLILTRSGALRVAVPEGVISGHDDDRGQRVRLKQRHVAHLPGHDCAHERHRRGAGAPLLAVEPVRVRRAAARGVPREQAEVLEEDNPGGDRGDGGELIS